MSKHKYQPMTSTPDLGHALDTCGGFEHVLLYPFNLTFNRHIYMQLILNLKCFICKCQSITGDRLTDERIQGAQNAMSNAGTGKKDFKVSFLKQKTGIV